MMKMWQRDNSGFFPGIRARWGRVPGLCLILAGVAGVIGLPAGLRAQDATPAATPALPGPAGPAAPVAATLDSMSALNDEAKLGKGDRVSYRVVEEQKDPILLTVSDSGDLDVPLVGKFAATGKTCKQLAYELKPLLEKEYFYHATVIIGVETFSTRSKGTVYLEGQVQRQGGVPIPADETLTVSKAILLDGGLADFADKRKVKLIRKKADGTTETKVVDLVEILDKGHTDLDPVVQADDMIIVPQRLVNW
jgi:polysaccharide export outer membrane protein